jgi:hypothetical protein
MAALAWVVAPWLAERIEGLVALPRALLALLTVGLIWQFMLVVLLVYRERARPTFPGGSRPVTRCHRPTPEALAKALFAQARGRFLLGSSYPGSRIEPAAKRAEV